MGETTFLFVLDGSQRKYGVGLSVDGKIVARGNFEYDSAAVELTVDKIEENACDLDSLKLVGRELWDWLRSGEVGDYLEKTFPAWAQQRGVWQFRLDIRSRELEALPWETLHDVRLGFLCEKRGPMTVNLMRDPGPDFVGRRGPLRPRDPLRVLTVIPQGSMLQVEQETYNLRTCIDPFPDRVQMTVLDRRVTVDRLSDALGRAEFDIVHYVGHGKLGSDRKARVRFNADGDFDAENWIEGELFADMLAERPPTLVFLNCCLSGSSSTRGTLSGLGPYLLRAGVPAIVAMRYEIPDHQAIKFSSDFYRELIQGKLPGRLDQAVGYARRGLFRNQTDSTVRGFVTPVVYLAAGCEQLFAWEAAAPMPAAVPSLPPPPAPAPTVKPPWYADLTDALKQRRCIPVIGPGIWSVGAKRLQPAVRGVRKLASEVAQRYPYASLEEEMRLCEQAGEWLDFAVFQWICQHYNKKAGAKWFQLPSELATMLQPVVREAIPALSRFLARWPDTPGIICTHFDGLVLESLRGQDVKVVDRIDDPSIDIAKGDRILLNLRGSLDHPESLVLTKDQHDKLWDRINNVSPAMKHHFTGTLGRCFLFLGVHPRDDLVHHLVDRLVEDKRDWCAGSFFVTRRWASAEEGYWEPLKIAWIEASDLGAVLEILGD